MTFNQWRIKNNLSTNTIALSLTIPQYVVVNWDAGYPIPAHVTTRFKQIFGIDPDTFKKE